MRGVKYSPPPYPPGMREKKQTEHTREECITELKRLAESFKDVYITRDFFRQNSDVTEATWTSYFGKYPEFLRAAGLWESRYRSRFSNKVAARASTDNIKALSESRFAYEHKYFKDKSKRFQKGVVCSDLHDQDVDPFYMRSLIHAIKQIEPDFVILNGDIFDFPEISKYGVDLREYDPVGRISYGRDHIIKPIREAAPDASIDFIEGNHEARVLRHLAESDPFMRELLSDYHDINDVGSLLKLDEYEINYIARVNLCKFTDNTKKLDKEVWNQNYKIYFNSFLAHHLPEGRKYNMPGFHGHHHKHTVVTEFSAKYGPYEWHQLGAGCRRLADYTDGTKWTNGFLVVHCDTQNERTDFQYITVNPTYSVVCGQLLERKPEEYYPELHQELRMQVPSPRPVPTPTKKEKKK